MWDLMGGYRQCRHQTQWDVGQESRRDQDAVQGVVDAVANENEDPGRAGVAVIVPMAEPVMAVPMVTLLGVSVPPEDELLDDEEDSQTGHHRGTHRMCTFGPDSLHRFREQPQQGSTYQRARRKAHEVRQHPQSRVLGHQQEQAGARGARYTAHRGKQDDPAEKGQGSRRFVTPSRKC
jgi:hypothetical protein